jgi:hypothetical protein
MSRSLSIVLVIAVCVSVTAYLCIRPCKEVREVQKEAMRDYISKGDDLQGVIYSLRYPESMQRTNYIIEKGVRTFAGKNSPLEMKIAVKESSKNKSRKHTPVHDSIVINNLTWYCNDDGGEFWHSELLPPAHGYVKFRSYFTESCSPQIEVTFTIMSIKSKADADQIFEDYKSMFIPVMNTFSVKAK